MSITDILAWWTWSSNAFNLNYKTECQNSQCYSWDWNWCSQFWCCQEMSGNLHNWDLGLGIVQYQNYIRRECFPSSHPFQWITQYQNYIRRPCYPIFHPFQWIKRPKRGNTTSEGQDLASQSSHPIRTCTLCDKYSSHPFHPIPSQNIRTISEDCASPAPIPFNGSRTQSSHPIRTCTLCDEYNAMDRMYVHKSTSHRNFGYGS